MLSTFFTSKMLLTFSFWRCMHIINATLRLFPLHHIFGPPSHYTKPSWIFVSYHNVVLHPLRPIEIFVKRCTHFPFENVCVLLFLCTPHLTKRLKPFLYSRSIHLYCLIPIRIQLQIVMHMWKFIYNILRIDSTEGSHNWNFALLPTTSITCSIFTFLTTVLSHQSPFLWSILLPIFHLSIDQRCLLTFPFLLWQRRWKCTTMTTFSLSILPCAKCGQRSLHTASSPLSVHFRRDVYLYWSAHKPQRSFTQYLRAPLQHPYKELSESTEEQDYDYILRLMTVLFSPCREQAVYCRPSLATEHDPRDGKRRLLSAYSKWTIPTHFCLYVAQRAASIHELQDPSACLSLSVDTKQILFVLRSLISAK